MSRRNLTSTPVTEKAPSQTGLPGSEPDHGKESEQGHSSPAGEPSPGHSRPNDDIAQQAASQGGVSGEAVDDSIMKDEMDEPEYSPPGASPVDMALDNVALPKSEASPETAPASTQGFATM
jgi:hypothetical protein